MIARNFRRAGVLAVLLLAVPLGAVPAEAQSSRTEHTLRLDEGGSPAAAGLSDVAWLAGRWVGEGLGATVEEAWLPAAAGAMAGVFRVVGEDSVRFYELVTLVEEAGSLVLRLKHFGPDLVGWEGRDESVEFVLVRRADDALWFDGLTIRRDGEGRMRIWVALESGEGEEREALFEYRRVGHDEAGAGEPGGGR